ncbi:hypothetical protein QYM36_016172 [Artemia franciscana]|uniref:Peptidase M12B domain-containing protein n=1 Tax=Artemia franciscana TaxID=6661 RepID=A0AA88KW68_ARTSF|nr:hypothetical protein QYM36_016172 [Artemia franciscana]
MSLSTDSRLHIARDNANHKRDYQTTGKLGDSILNIPDYRSSEPQPLVEDCNQERELVETSCSARDAECCYDLQEENGLIAFKNHSIAESNTTQYFSDTSHNANQELYRSARSVVYPFYGRKEIRVVELVLVVDGTLLKNYGSDSRKIEAKFLEILSYVNFLYFQFHVRVALVGIDYWFYGDKIKISKDADFNLRGFNLYRKIELPKKFKYDHALLLR